MKSPFCIYFLVFFIFACDNKNKTITTNETSLELTKIQESNKENKKQGIALKQNGDYTALFSTTDLCSLLKTSEIEQVLALPAGSVEHQENKCSAFIITLEDGSKSPLNISIFDMESRESIIQETESYINDNSGLLNAKVSNTGDNYLCFHNPREWLIVYNTEYLNCIKLGFNTTSYATVNRKKGIMASSAKIARENAEKIANYLLKKYQK